MSEAGQELRQVNWRALFSFTLIFNSFRLSRHTTKLAIALAGVLLTWGAGTLLDLAFRPFSDIYVRKLSTGAVQLEPEGAPRFAEFRDSAERAAKAELVTLALQYNAAKGADARKEADSSPCALAREIRQKLEEAYASQKTALEKAWDPKKVREEDRDRQYDIWLGQIRALNDEHVRKLRDLELCSPQGPFETFLAYESRNFRGAVSAVVQGRLLGGLHGLMEEGERAASSTAAGEPAGLLYYLVRMAGGVAWLFQTHEFFGVVFLLVSLAIWGLAGGAIARAAALQATRDEKAGIAECIRFALKKFPSFVASPLLPLGIFLFVGLVLVVLFGLLGSVPQFGGLWLAIWFGLIFLIGLGLAALLIGLVAGGSLMAPTVAVEGSDTFDAFTRSYQFVIARPWRAALYGLVATVYGSICYIFVRFVLFLTLKISHGIIQAASLTSRDEVRAGASKWELMWSGPRFDDFAGGGVSPVGVSALDWFGGWFIVNIWVGLVTALLAAWAVSFLISAATDIYLLLRHAEDSTDLKEVFVEEPEEEEVEAEPAVPAADESAPPQAPAAPAPGTEAPPSGPGPAGESQKPPARPGAPDVVE